MAVDKALIRKYNVPAGVPDANIDEHIAKATAERSRRLEFSSYTGTYTTEYDEILIHLTLKRIYKYEDTFFINGIPESVNDIKTNAVLHGPSDLESMIAREEREAQELVAFLKKAVETADDALLTVGGITMAAVGGNPDYYPTESE